MTPEQDFERRLADWLADGPNTAPSEVVDRGLAQTARRQQRRGPRLWLVLLLERVGLWFPTHRAARLATITAVLAVVLLTSAVITLPFGGSPASTPDPGPPPVMDGNASVAIDGTAEVDIPSKTPTKWTRVVDIETGDERIDGQAQQELTVLAQSANAHQLQGTMHLANDWGAWTGPVDIVRYPSGEEYEFASLHGSGAYAGFIYEYTTHQATAEAERTVKGAIWPGEPPPLPDPSSLP